MRTTVADGQIFGGKALSRRLLDWSKTQFLPIPPAFSASVEGIPSVFCRYILNHKTGAVGYCVTLFSEILRLSVLV